MEPLSAAPPASLRANLDHEPRPLQFGTSGRRGDVVHLTQLEIYINALAELEYLQSLPRAEGGVVRGDDFYFAYDLRPSSSRYVAEQGGRGEIAQAIARAIQDAGMRPVNLGRIPTPALMFHALQNGKGGMMVTGSHIPFERNGYKTNKSTGELLKTDEGPIGERVGRVRARLYHEPYADSAFNRQGLFKSGHQELPPETRAARDAFCRRYEEFFSAGALRGRKLLVYQHSAVGRDLLVDILQGLGAEAIPAGRSDTFVPIDTENIDREQLDVIQALADQAWAGAGPFDAIVSTDGDSDRPLILGVERAAEQHPCRVRFYGGDLVGMIVAEFLGADAVVVPISCNDAVDRGALRDIVRPKTRIGSPYVVAGMEAARLAGRTAICGWEANGGFLTGSDMRRRGRLLKSLPTRDAFLPILAVLARMCEENIPLPALFSRLPGRFSRAALIRNFPMPVSRKIIASLSPPDPEIVEIAFEENGPNLIGRDSRARSPEAEVPDHALAVRSRLGLYFDPDRGFGSIRRINYTDGVRITFGNGDVAHIRPSGNAPELRIYALADTQERADAISRMGVEEPDGILRRMERAVAADADAAPQSPAPESGALRGRIDEPPVKAFKADPRIVRLEGTVQHYDWGGLRFIPGLLGIDNRGNRPFAELWMGTHPRGPSAARLGPSPMPLALLIEGAAEEILGPAAAARFGGRLPFLFKVLDVRRMLSIQAHPGAPGAREGFAREEAAGVPPDAPERNYRDRGHKPEMHVALSEFWMLHGFRPPESIVEEFRATPELRRLMPDFFPRAGRADDALLRDLFRAAMTIPQDDVDAILNPLIGRLERGGPLEKSNPGYWALRAGGDYPLAGGHRDRGILSIFMLNLVHLLPGEGTFQPAGTLHAYLEGVTVELMTNSDNVLRAGLTPKHVDAGELMRIVKFESEKPRIIAGSPVSGTETVYRAPAEEFQLSRLNLSPGRIHADAGAGSAQILIVMEGRVAARSGGQSCLLNRGEIFLVPYVTPYELTCEGDSALLYKAAIPPCGREESHRPHGVHSLESN